MNIIRKPFKYTFFNATFCIIALNFLVYFLTLSFSKLKFFLGLSVFGTLEYHYWFELFTYMFVHQNFQHIFFNMLGLFFFGIYVEKAIGSKEFLLFYILCGVLDGAISIAVYYFCGLPYVRLIGASGAVYSVLLAYAVIYPRSIISIWGIIPVPAPLLVIIYVVIELGSEFFRVDNVAHFTHLAGFFVAWLYLRVRMGLKPIKIWKEAWRR